MQRLAARALPQGPCRLVLALRAYPEQRSFELWPEPGSAARHPLVAGVYSLGRPRQGIVGWLDLDVCDHVTLDDGQVLDCTGHLGRRLFRALGRLVPPNGRLMVAYEMFAHEGETHRATRQELALGVPPLATPLGVLLFAAGCWLNIRDWYIPEGGREGPRKLQGNRPLDEQHLRRRAGEAMAELAGFLVPTAPARPPALAPARRRAARLLAALRRRFGEEVGR
ncbi:MAG: DUF1122 family protein [Chloroflexi bacterium]|nr:DUF1122 family protein [Chloroflexota bacterium]